MAAKYETHINRKILLIAATVLVGFGYASYFLWGEIVSAGALYSETYKDLISLEEKQKQIIQLQAELQISEKSREEVLSSLLSRDDTLVFILRIEDIARKAGLSYNVRISQEITKDAIEQERLALRQSRRKAKKDVEALEGKLPGIVFSIEIDGSYYMIILKILMPKKMQQSIGHKKNLAKISV